MESKDLEKLVESVELSESAKNALTKYIVDSYFSLFESGIKKAMESCKTREDSIRLLTRLEGVHTYLIQPIIEDRTDDIKGEFRRQLIVDSKKYEVKYHVNFSEYPTLGHAILDFRLQANLPVQYLARRLEVSTRTVIQFEENQTPIGKKGMDYFVKNEGRIKKSLLNLFIVPEEDITNFMSLPLYVTGIPPAKSEYKRKKIGINTCVSDESDKDVTLTALKSFVLTRMKECGYMTQEELARIAEINPSTLSYVLSRRKSLTNINAEKLAKALKITTQELEKIKYL